MQYGLEMSRAENFCPLPAPRQKFLSSVHTASAFVVHFPVRDRTAPHHPTLFEFLPPQLLPRQSSELGIVMQSSYFTPHLMHFIPLHFFALLALGVRFAYKSTTCYPFKLSSHTSPFCYCA